MYRAFLILGHFSIADLRVSPWGWSCRATLTREAQRLPSRNSTGDRTAASSLPRWRIADIQASWVAWPRRSGADIWPCDGFGRNALASGGVSCLCIYGARSTKGHWRGLMDSRFQPVLIFQLGKRRYDRRLKGYTPRVMFGSVNRSDACTRGGNPPGSRLCRIILPLASSRIVVLRLSMMATEKISGSSLTPPHSTHPASRPRQTPGHLGNPSKCVWWQNAH